MTKLEYEKITELLKELNYYTKIMEGLVQGTRHILVSKFSDGSDMNRHSLNEEELKEILNMFLNKREKVYLQLKELGYYD